VNILVFVRGAENLEFSGPISMPLDKTLAQVQGETININNQTKKP